MRTTQSCRTDENFRGANSGKKGDPKCVFEALKHTARRQIERDEG